MPSEVGRTTVADVAFAEGEIIAAGSFVGTFVAGGFELPNSGHWRGGDDDGLLVRFNSNRDLLSARSFGIPESGTWVNSVATATRRDVILSTSSVGNTAGTERFGIRRVTQDGVVVWVREFACKGHFTDAARLDDGSIAVVGYALAYNCDSPFIADRPDGSLGGTFAAVLSDDGEVRWSQTLLSSGSTAHVVAADGAIVVTTGAGIFCFDSDGAENWVIDLPGVTVHDAERTATGVVFVGHTNARFEFADTVLMPSPQTRRAFVAHIRTDGTQTWMTALDSSTALSVAETPNGLAVLEQQGTPPSTTGLVILATDSGAQASATAFHGVFSGQLGWNERTSQLILVGDVPRSTNPQSMFGSGGFGAWRLNVTR